MPKLLLLRSFIILLLLQIGSFAAAADLPPEFSGIYPSLAMFNDEGECGTGAVVPWADRLWVITYGPHKPFGSSDKLYEITKDLKQTVRPESVGGTPADRMIHRETNQLLIGPYVIDKDRNVRAISPRLMPGRLTGAARHLTDPAGKVYIATMEEGLYEVDMKTLAVTGLLKDLNGAKAGQTSEEHPATLSPKLPGYHGKGLYTGQDRLIYAQNGEHGAKAEHDPTTISGALAEWHGKGDWELVRRNQFTEVTGPGGIYGNASADQPVWSVGFDHKSLILALCDDGKWSYFRLPKGSHSYDGAHGWHTEWPRIRNIGIDDKPDYLMTMHGLLWHFPETFSAKNTAGIYPYSAFLKITGDFARWNDQIVFGCDDAAQSEFTNKRKIKGECAGPGQSQSNLWFVHRKDLTEFGPNNAGGSVWLNEAVKAGQTSDPMLFASEYVSVPENTPTTKEELISGWKYKTGYFANGGDKPITFTLEVDSTGKGQWKKFAEVEVPAGSTAWQVFPTVKEPQQWIRAVASADCPSATVDFEYANPDDRKANNSSSILSDLTIGTQWGPRFGLLWPRGENKRTLLVAANHFVDGKLVDAGPYELDADMHLKRMDDDKKMDAIKAKVPLPKHVVTVDDASVLIVDDRGRRWRLPKGDAKFDELINDGLVRLAREVATERDLFNCHGTFYELPAETADGFAHIRPIASHEYIIMDFCSYRGMMILTGVKSKYGKSGHVIESDDGKAAVWAGAIDDLWQLGVPTGQGGPWKDTEVKANSPSDPYLIGFYQKRTLKLSHQSKESVKMTVELDPTGHGPWVKYREFDVPPGMPVEHRFPDALSARWLRVKTDRATNATAWLSYKQND